MNKRKATIYIAVLALFMTAASVSQPVRAQPIDVDVMWVVDRSGSMGGEFSFLGGAIGGFLNDLQADARIGTARAGLIAYEGSASVADSEKLFQNLTTNATDLSNAFGSVSLRGGREDAFRAIDSALPGGNVNLGVNWGTGTRRVLILVTDEDADDGVSGSSPPYSNIFATGTPTGDIAALVDADNALLNIIYEFADNPDAGLDYVPIARPAGALFDIGFFRDHRQEFFDQFTRAKIREITGVPEPSMLALLGLGLAGLGLWRRRFQLTA